MKTKTTHITQTVACQSSVEITVQPKDTDEGFNQITLRVVPQDNGCLIVVSGITDKIVSHDLGPANYATLVWRTQDEAQAEMLLHAQKLIGFQLENKQRDYNRVLEWLRIAIDKPNGFALWADTNKAQGLDPIALILKGTPTSAVILKG